MTTNDGLGERLSAAAAVPAAAALERLTGDLAARAAREGLLDVAYAPVDSPVGTLLVSATPRGVVRLAFDNETEEQVLQQLAERVSPRILRAPARLDEARRELDEYFAGRRTAFEIPLDWALTSGFRRKVLAAAAGIPYAHTATYRSLAIAAGSPHAFRAAGTALATNPLPILIPCHRVLPASGALGQYRGGPGRKRRLLDLEAGSAQARERAGGAIGPRG